MAQKVKNQDKLQAKLKKVQKDLAILYVQHKDILDVYQKNTLGTGALTEEAQKLAPFWKIFYDKVWETPEAATFRKCRDAWQKGDMEAVRACTKEAQFRIESQKSTFMRKPSAFDPEWLRASWPVSCYLHLTNLKAQYEQELGIEPQEEDTFAAAQNIWDR